MTESTVVYSHEKKLQTIIHSNHHIRNLVRRNVHHFLSLREELLDNSIIQCLMASDDPQSPLIDTVRIEQLNARVTSDKIQLALCGENSSGKTAFLHAFLNIGKILPSGDGPVTARITKLTYAVPGEACIRIKKSLRNHTLIDDEINLSTYFSSEKPNWMGIGRALAKHVKRPEGIDEKSLEFAEWARSVVEIHIPSSTLALGVDVYDTPGFLSDDAPVLKEILHDLVELIHPTLVFMYANPSTDDATKGCFLAVKTALHDIDEMSIFFLNSKADLTRMPKFKQGMNENEFLTILADERIQRYKLLLDAPFLVNDKLEGLPISVDQCQCFDLCSVNSQSIKPHGPTMNEATIRRIIQFVANNDLAVAKRVCKLVLPAIDSFFDLLHITTHRTPEHLLQLYHDAQRWEKNYSEIYKSQTDQFLSDLFSKIFQQLNIESKSIVQLISSTRIPQNLIQLTVKTAVRLQVITPAVRETLRNFMNHVFEHISSHSGMIQDVVSNEILFGALRNQEISDFSALLLDGYAMKNTGATSILYIVNTISTPVLVCSRNIQQVGVEGETASRVFLEEIRQLPTVHDKNRPKQLNDQIYRYLSNIEMMLVEKKNEMQQAIELWRDQERAKLLSRIQAHYDAARPLLSLTQETHSLIEKHISHFIDIECQLCAAEDMAKMNGLIPEIRSGDSKSTMFSLFTAAWGDKKNLLVKKLSRSLPDQPIAAYYEAHYHRRVAKLCVPNIFHLSYLYEHRLDEQIFELWMIFLPIHCSLEQYLQELSGSIPIKTILKWLISIIHALVILHKNCLIHRNIVPSNIVITADNCAMLIDLGNWYDESDLSIRHDLSSTINGANEDIKGFGEIGQILNAFIEQDETISAIIGQFNELILICAQANYERPMTAEVVQQKLNFINDMF
ncbi:unnamed protein product [Rotaria socialis]|uniref:Protein kinase domain-containing protein n=1 Tax=Rotaria socialis TaxID=392032 RepID=A0A817N164_9BILA|nr:unnamed protein product [Rotaria socialis]CAF4494601.1 unnamed protein product [Rotaria socialis]